VYKTSFRISDGIQQGATRTAKYDCVVIGLGAMGSSALYHMSKQKINVLGLEQFQVSHPFGSSHGLSRIIRLAYYEHPVYVDLLKRAFVLWDELESVSKNKRLFTQTGSLDIGFKNSRTFVGSKESCRVHKLEHSILDRSQLIDRFEGWQSIPVDDDLYAGESNLIFIRLVYEVQVQRKSFIFSLSKEWWCSQSGKMCS
jgi:sarcosine oxidase